MVHLHLEKTRLESFLWAHKSEFLAKLVRPNPGLENFLFLVEQQVSAQGSTRLEEGKTVILECPCVFVEDFELFDTRSHKKLLIRRQQIVASTGQSGKLVADPQTTLEYRELA